MFADYCRNLGRVGKIETLPILQICPHSSQTIGDIYDFEFSLVGKIWDDRKTVKSQTVWDFPSLLRSRSGRSHVTLAVPTRLLQTDIRSFLGVLHFCLFGPMSLSFSCRCIRCTNHRREHSQENERHTLIGLFPRKECMSV